MKKAAFLRSLAQQLKGIPPSDIRQTLAYYSEAVSDAMDDGLDEEAAVRSLGTAEEIALSVKEELAGGGKLPQTRKRSGFTVLLLILGFPVWFSLLAAGAGILTAVFICIVALAVAAWALPLAFAAGTLYAAVCALLALVHGNLTVCACFAGAALVCAGLCILTYQLCKSLPRRCAALIRTIWTKLKALCFRRRNAK